ncbi:hypothetical protein [Nocardioides rubriscoriae]|uniref:hypothetical protein n=1 Tax=Nocardioides rubriscoriae TaxID=642762 RepID=UPI0011DF0154|nr:hypothetical protein [Nocardioides rubriscoriae]
MTADVRPLTHDDLDWVAGLTAVRRESLAPHAPRFWRPAAGATAKHRTFLGRLVDDPAALTLRTEHGYLMALGDDTRRVVDDMAVAEGHWVDEGVALLQAVVEQAATVRFVVPVAEAERRATAEAVRLRPVETWWHRDLPLVQVRGEGDRVELSTAGARGRLVPAPPVYDPGGPVLLVADVETGAALGLLEDEAAERGATVSVVTQRADDLMRELLLVEAGYVRTTAFFETIDA